MTRLVGNLRARPPPLHSTEPTTSRGSARLAGGREPRRVWLLHGAAFKVGLPCRDAREAPAPCRRHACGMMGRPRAARRAGALESGQARELLLWFRRASSCVWAMVLRRAGLSDAETVGGPSPGQSRLATITTPQNLPQRRAGAAQAQPPGNVRMSRQGGSARARPVQSQAGSEAGRFRGSGESPDQAGFSPFAHRAKWPSRNTCTWMKPALSSRVARVRAVKPVRWPMKLLPCAKAGR